MDGILTMARAGRKRKVGVKRTASGQRSRAKVVAENAMPIATRMRLYGLSEADARDQKAGTVVGRMRLEQQRWQAMKQAVSSISGPGLSEPQYQAAIAYLGAYDAFKRAVKAPDAMRAGLGSGADLADSDSHAEWCQRAIQSYEGACQAIARADALNRGSNCVAAVEYVVCRDMAFVHMENDLRLGLEALADYFGLTESVRRGG